MVLYLPRERIAASEQAASASTTQGLVDDITRQKQQAEAPPEPQYALPSLSALTGNQSPIMSAIGALPQMGQQAAQRAQGALEWALPDLSSLGVTQPEPAHPAVPTPQTTPPQPEQTMNGTPITAPQGAGGPSVASSSGSNPEKQAEVYREARASGLDDEGARILVAVTETEGGLAGAIGDQGRSRGPFQFHEGGQMPGFRAWLGQQGIQGDPNTLVHDVRLTTRYAATTYLGQAIAAGRARGLSGADLATYVQQYGQVSVDPWKTGQNYQRLYGSGASSPVQMPDVPNQNPGLPPPVSMPDSSARRATPSAASTGMPDEPMPQDGRDWVYVNTDPRYPAHRGWRLRENAQRDGMPTVYDPRQSSMNNAGAALPSAPAPAAGPGAPPPPGPVVPPTVAQRWQAQFGRPMTDQEAAELQQAMSAMGVM